MGGRSPRTELLRLQRTLFRHNAARIREAVVVEEEAFGRYERRYRRAVRGYQRAMAPQSLIKTLQHRDIVYVGDYHTCAQSQRSFLRVLRAMHEADRSMCIGVELVHKRAQRHLDAYLDGSLGEDDFVHAAKLHRHWIFDLWPNFRPIFEFARLHGVPMLAIEAGKRGASLAERDAASGELLAQYSADHPDELLFAFIGDLHLAPQHLPKETMRACAEIGVTRRDYILYQNSESIYWQLAEKGREHKVSLVRIDERSACRLHVPPVIYQQSYLNWLEHDEGEIDYSDAKHQFIGLVDQIMSFLRIDVDDAAKHDVQVYTCGELGFLEQLRRKKVFSARELAHIRRHVLSAESYFIPHERMVYLASLSLNHASEEAAHFVKYLLCGAEKARPVIDAFYTNTLHEALGFFGSKLVNPKRKCMHLRDYRATVREVEVLGEVPDEMALEYETARLLIDYVAQEKRGRPLQCLDIFYPSAELFFSLTHALGYMLGDRMFHAVMQRKLGRSAVTQLFVDSWSEEGDAFAAYMRLLDKMCGVKLPKRL